MQTSEKIDLLIPALLVAQRACGAIHKDKKNTHFGSTYADLASVIATAIPALNAADIVCVQGARSSADGVTVETRLVHASGQWVSEELFLPVPKKDSQSYGGAITYCRRYGLLAILALATEDDDGNAASAPPPKKRAVEAPQARAPVERPSVQSLMGRLGIEWDAVADVIRELTGRECPTYKDAMQTLTITERETVRSHLEGLLARAD
jgi:hypothetical protein